MYVGFGQPQDFIFEERAVMIKLNLGRVKDGMQFKVEIELLRLTYNTRF
jgi:hypothetical protein